MATNMFIKTGITITRTLLIFLLVLICSCTSYHVQNFNAKNLSNDQELAKEDPGVTGLFTPYKDSIDKNMSTIISVSEKELQKGKPESLLTNFFADFYLEDGARICEERKLGFIPDVGYQNYGGIRIPLPKGNITVGKIFELMPFENELVFLKLTGEQMKTFLDQIAAKGGDSLSGVRFGIKSGKATNIMVGGMPIDVNKTYWLATNDYVAEGGDELSVLKKRSEIIYTGLKIRDLLINYLENRMKKGIRISPEPDGRIYNE